MIENLVSGKKYRILTDAANDVWDRISFWTKASDVHYDDGTTAEENKPAAMLKRNTAYTVGTIAYETTAPSWVMLRCTTAGTTASTRPTTYATISSVGTVITDGTAKFTVYDMRPSATLSTSAYQIPTMNLVNNLNSELTVNGTKFYFDYQNGRYGYNTSASRGASTFFPFGEGNLNRPTNFAGHAWYGGAASYFFLDTVSFPVIFTLMRLDANNCSRARFGYLFRDGASSIGDFNFIPVGTSVRIPSNTPCCLSLDVVQQEGVGVLEATLSWS